MNGTYVQCEKCSLSFSLREWHEVGRDWVSTVEDFKFLEVSSGSWNYGIFHSVIRNRNELLILFLPVDSSVLVELFKRLIFRAIFEILWNLYSSRFRHLSWERLGSTVVMGCEVMRSFFCRGNRYITVLVEMTKFEGTRSGKQIAAQMLDITIRVKTVRPFSVRQMVGLRCTHIHTLVVIITSSIH